MYGADISYRTPMGGREPNWTYLPDAWRPAPLWRRFSALALDVTAAIGIAMLFLYIGEITGALQKDPDGGYTSGLSLLFGLVPPLIYWFVPLARWDRTPAKALFRIKVVDHKTGERPGFIWHLFREFGWFIDSQIMGLVGLFLILSSTEHRRFGDRWSGTIVVDANPERQRGRYVMTDGATIVRMKDAKPQPTRTRPVSSPAPDRGIRMSDKPSDKPE